jgi:signal transduction histidine kinase
MKLRLGERLTKRWFRLRLPGRTIRLRLTLLYGGLFLVSGAALLAVTYVLVRQATGNVLVGTKKDGSSVVISSKGSGGKGKGTGAATNRQRPSFEGQVKTGPLAHLTPRQLRAQASRDLALAKHQHAAELRQLLEQSGIALAIMAAFSIALGWIVAGRVLRPLRTITNAAREITASNLHRRLALEGPDDELTRLGNTFDGLLERLEASFAAQRQFVANASHELRTPVTFERTLLEVALADPSASAETLRRACEQLLANSHQQERLIEALLTLSRSQRGLDRRESFDLAGVTDTALAARRQEADLRGLSVRATLEPAPTSGDRSLAERLVANLLDNALRHNKPHGYVDVMTRTESGRAVLSVSNSGPIVPSDDVERLFQPFRRLGADRTDHSDGIGLGLSIVQAIATAHDASLSSRALVEGGLVIAISFPSAAKTIDTLTAPVAEREPGVSGRRIPQDQRRPVDLRNT